MENTAYSPEVSSKQQTSHNFNRETGNESAEGLERLSTPPC